MSLTASLRVSFKGRQTGANDIAAQDFSPEITKLLEFANGTGANQADLLFVDERTIAASGSEEIDLAGSLSDAFGATITAAEVVGLLVVADAGNTNDVVVGGAASNAFVGPFAAADNTVSVGPGGIFAIFSPDASGIGTVTASTGDLLKVANSSSGTGVTYKLAVLARSA